MLADGLDLIVPSFDLDNATIVQATEKLANYDLLVCVEVRTQDEHAPRLTLHRKNQSLRQILDAITGQMPDYAWQEHFSHALAHRAIRIVNLTPQWAQRDATYPLEVNTGPLDVRDAIPEDLIRHVQYQIPELLTRVKHRGGNSTGIYPLTPPAVKATINIKTTGLSVREFLNELAAAANAPWVCVLDDLPGGGFCYEH